MVSRRGLLTRVRGLQRPEATRLARSLDRDVLNGWFIQDGKPDYQVDGAELAELVGLALDQHRREDVDDPDRQVHDLERIEGHLERVGLTAEPTAFAALYDFPADELWERARASGKEVPLADLEYGWILPDGTAVEVTSLHQTHPDLVGGKVGWEAALTAGAIRVGQWGEDRMYHVRELTPAARRGLEAALQSAAGSLPDRLLVHESSTDRSFRFSRDDLERNGFRLNPTLREVERLEAGPLAVIGDDCGAKVKGMKPGARLDPWLECIQRELKARARG